MFNVLDRSPRPACLLRAARALLRPGGHLLIASPLPYRPFFFEGGRTFAPLADSSLGSSSTTTILGYCSSSLPDSNEPLCVLNRQRELALPRLTAAPTATSSAYL